MNVVMGNFITKLQVEHFIVTIIENYYLRMNLGTNKVYQLVVSKVVQEILQLKVLKKQEKN